MDPRSQSDWDNHSNQLNPNNDAYWQSRGFDERPYYDDDDDYNSSEKDDYDDDDDYFGEYTSFSWDFD